MKKTAKENEEKERVRKEGKSAIFSIHREKDEHVCNVGQKRFYSHFVFSLADDSFVTLCFLYLFFSVCLIFVFEICGLIFEEIFIWWPKRSERGKTKPFLASRTVLADLLQTKQIH